MNKKQLLWILLLSFAAAMLLQRFLGERNDTAPDPTTTTAPMPEVPADTDNPWSYGGTRLPDAHTAPTYRIGSLDPDGDYRLQLELDPRGAAVRTAKLAGHYLTVEQKRTKDKTPEQLEAWSYAVLQPVEGPSPRQTVLPFSTESLLIDGRAITTFVSPERNGASFAWQMLDKVVEDDGTQRIRFRLNLRLDPAGEPLYTLIKTYTLRPASYSFGVRLRVENHSGETRRMAVAQHGPTGVPREDVRTDLRDAMAATYLADQEEIVILKGGKVEQAKADSGHILGDNRPGTTDRVVWAGASNKFFACLMYPVPAELDLDAVDALTPTAELVVPPDQYTFAFAAETVGSTDNAFPLVTMATDALDVDDGDALELEMDIFAGPKSHGLFENVPLYARLRYTNAITFRTCTWCLFEPLARLVMWIIEAGGRAIGNYGVIIILMVLLIRLALHPITKRSQVSMMSMKKLQPQMQAIQEKYKDDKEAKQKAMMEVWKQTGISPLLGCAPMLLQMPIWIALWAGLNASVVLRHEGLLPFWITNLAGPDTVLAFARPLNIPLLDNMVGPIVGLNILPLLLTVFMFLQQKLTPMQAAAANPDQAKQQKIMMYMMSLMMLLIFYNAPSGLTLYIMASTGAGVLESYIIRKHIRQREEIEAAREVKVAAPGKAARGTRPKKPKDRFRM